VAKERFRTYFVRGMAVLLPTFLTIGILVWAFGWITGNISGPVAGQLERLLRWITSDKFVTDRLDEQLLSFALNMAAFLIALCIAFIVGAMLANVVGKTLWRMVERFIMNTPILKQVYPYVKQVTDFFLTRKEQKKLFSRVVAVEYPRKGIWSMGFVTGSGIEKVSGIVRKEMLTVLIPTSPTPFTGFVIMVPKKQTIELDMTIEQALRFTVSGGVITPHVSNFPSFAQADSETK
jgi:uncharacterized membrane protein